MTPQPKIYVAGHRGMVGSAIVRQLQAMDCHVAGAPRNDGTIIKDSITSRDTLIEQVQRIMDFMVKHTNKAYIITGKRPL